MAAFEDLEAMEPVEEESPVEEMPSEEAPSEETPSEEAPSEEMPSEEAPSEEAPSEEAPSEEAPSEEASSEEVPSEETPEVDISFEDQELGGVLDESNMGFDVPDASFYDQLPDASDVIKDDLFENPSDSDEEDTFSESDVSDVSEAQEDTSHMVTFGDAQYLLTFDGESIPFTITALSDLDVVPYAVTSSNAAYTPQTWQVNLAENRSFGEHYIMWAERVYSGSSYYWRYYLALGSQISYASNTYSYIDAEVYTYYNYNSSVTYDVSVSSGTVSGSSYLVYSDLYFDYVGVDPAFQGSIYIFFALFLIVIALLVIGGKRNV